MKTFLDKIREYKYNHFCKEIEINKDGHLYFNAGTKLYLKEGAKVTLNDKLHMGYNAFINNGRTTILRLDEDAELEVNGSFQAYYGADIICFAGAKLVLNGGFINSDTKIRCMKNIVIGRGACISHDVTIIDGDGHSIVYPEYVERKPIVIEEHVWIGTKATILKGVTVGTGSIIAAGAVVTKDVPPHCLVAGNPARVIKENVEWR